MTLLAELAAAVCDGHSRSVTTTRLATWWTSEQKPIALAAIGFTRRVWRRDSPNEYVEGAHAGRRSRISHGEMFAANAATTRLVLEHLRPYPDVGWYALADAFVDPDRSAGRRTLVDLLGKTRHRRWARWAWGEIVFGIGPEIKDRGPENVLLALSAVHDPKVLDWCVRDQLMSYTRSPGWPDSSDGHSAGCSSSVLAWSIWSYA